MEDNFSLATFVQFANLESPIANFQLPIAK